MAIANFMEREVTELGSTVVGDLDHRGAWFPENGEAPQGLRLEADEDDELEEEELEDDFEDDFEEEDDDFDDEDDFDEEEDLDEADDDEDEDDDDY